jgi:hypothetical protein
MTIRFAAAEYLGESWFRRIPGITVPLEAANDNGDGIANDKMLRAALRHFAAHGLGAAEAARSNAERAFFAGDRAGFRWWLGICRILDRRMAEAVGFRRDVVH